MFQRYYDFRVPVPWQTGGLLFSSAFFKIGLATEYVHIYIHIYIQNGTWIHVCCGSDLTPGLNSGADLRCTYHQYYISRLHKNATVSGKAVGCKKCPCLSGIGLSPLVRTMKMNGCNEQLPCSAENRHYCTKALQLHWVGNQVPGQPCQGLLGSHLKSSWATMSGAPGWPHRGLLGSHVRGSWEAISGAPKQPSQSHQGAQQAPGSGKSAREAREEANLVWAPFSCREGNKQPCAWSAARGQAHFLVKRETVCRGCSDFQSIQQKLLSCKSLRTKWRSLLYINKGAGRKSTQTQEKEQQIHSLLIALQLWFPPAGSAADSCRRLTSMVGTLHSCVSLQSSIT